MSASIDPAKLKVVDLRTELTNRGLDTKGNKAALVKRLKDALEKELEQELPDTSIADTSTEDLDTSKAEETPTKDTTPTSVKKVKDKSAEKPLKTPEKCLSVKLDTSKAEDKAVEKLKPEIKSPVKPKEQVIPEKPKVEVKSTKPAVEVKLEKSKVDVKSDKPKVEVKTDKPKEVKSEPKVEVKEEKPNSEVKAQKPKSEAKVEKPISSIKVEKDEADSHKPQSESPEKEKHVISETKSPTSKTVGDDKQSSEPPSKKVKIEDNVENDKPADKESTEAKDEEKSDTSKTGADEGKDVALKAGKESERKGEKRKRTGESPERRPKRARSPIKEDEPEIDTEKVLLSWYDSDLHLVIDKETFLAAEPLIDGAFGYVWAGVRATHGVSSGKVCYEVKVTEEMSWDHFFKQFEGGSSHRDDSRSHSQKKDRRDYNKKSSKPSNARDAKEKQKDEKTDGKDVKTEVKDENPEVKNDELKVTDENSEGKNAKIEENDAKEKSSESVEKIDVTEADSVAVAESEKKMDTTEELSKGTDEQKVEESQTESMETDGLEEVKKPEEADDDSKAKDDDSKTKEDDSKTKEDDSKTKDHKTESSEKPSAVESRPIHFLRVGWSVANCNLQLGEAKHSYGFESTGKFVTDKQFVDYGIKFGVGDVVGAFLEIGEENIVIKYTVNGAIQPEATKVPKSELPENFVLFPHILTRNCSFKCNFGDRKQPWFPIPTEMEGYSYLSSIDNKVAGPSRPKAREECEVLLMFGLPGSGKTHWVREHIENNSEKRYTVLGNTSLLERMTVSGEPLKSNFKGRWSLLIDRMQKCLNRLISMASVRRRNYIIDQTNVFPSAQRRKMRPFEGFKRGAVIVIVEDEEQARRQSLQEVLDGKGVPDSTILEMKAAMCLPEKGDYIEELTFAGVDEDEAKKIVAKYNAAGKAAGFGTEKRFKDDRYRRHDSRDGRNYWDRGYQSQSFGYRGQWSNDKFRGGARGGSGGGGWNRDRQVGRGGQREWRGSGRDRDSSRENYSQGSYNRNQGHGGRGQWSGGGGGGGWGNQNWNRNESYGGYNNQNWGRSGGGGGGGGGGWKYNSGSGWGGQGYGSGQRRGGGGGGSYGNYNNYYGQQ